MESASPHAQGHHMASENERCVRLPPQGRGRLGEPWRRDVQQIMILVHHLAGLLKSQHLTLLTEQLEQAGYRTVASARTIEDDGGGFIKIARSCVQELESQLLLAREAGLPNRRAHEPMQNEFHEIRRMLAACIRRMRAGAKVQT